ncbi:DUF2490 domain-containing protein [Flavobacterium sp. 5]|uniref:DUF2490 domain-containing protein n=1 Tax=Flavobacterium sp. 5 TaxID=2035199 RepID=UPI000CB45210|nr:DUF2490 domain-containing protein [Flavobacterium sp. 5]PKB17727.1 uncharacterized protein DUF2490 [Flavobacterium sp. 5]
MKNVSNFFVLLFPILVFGQAVAKKEVNQQVQTWVSLNTVTKFAEHWGVVADVHIRENGFFESDNFYLLRGGVSYMPNSAVSLIGGYAHMWLAPTKEGWFVYSNENRIYQQVQLSSKIGKVTVLQRLRNEQRWQQIMINDAPSGILRFTDRVRYLASFTIPVFNNKKLPSLVLSDEILIQFGKDIVYNTFDQNRLFIGIKQNISPKLSYDFGYMNVYQEKINGYQYDMNHTIRLFFYLNSDVKHNPSKSPEHS